MGIKDDIERLLAQKRANIEQEEKLRKAQEEAKQTELYKRLEIGEELLAKTKASVVLEEINNLFLENIGTIEKYKGIYSYSTETGDFSSHIIYTTVPVVGISLSWITESTDRKTGIFIGSDCIIDYPSIRVYDFLPRSDSDLAELTGGCITFKKPVAIIDVEKNEGKRIGIFNFNRALVKSLPEQTREAIASALIRNSERGNLKLS